MYYFDNLQLVSCQGETTLEKRYLEKRYREALEKEKQLREERIRKGYIKIGKGPTPEGGYSYEAHFFDENGDYTSSEKSVTSRTLILDEHGNRIQERDNFAECFHFVSPMSRAIYGFII